MWTRRSCSQCGWPTGGHAFKYEAMNKQRSRTARDVGYRPAAVNVFSGGYNNVRYVNRLWRKKGKRRGDLFNFLWSNITLLLHWPAKTFPKIIFQYSVSLSPAEYEYANRFFHITSRFSETLWQTSKNQQNTLVIGCVYAEVNQQIQWFAYVKCFSWNIFHPYF